MANAKGVGKALSAPPLNKAILEPRKIKTKRIKKPLNGGKQCLELK
jgi:hypothetical protein